MQPSFVHNMEYQDSLKSIEDVPFTSNSTIHEFASCQPSACASVRGVCKPAPRSMTMEIFRNYTSQNSAQTGSHELCSLVNVLSLIVHVMLHLGLTEIMQNIHNGFQNLCVSCYLYNCSIILL